MTDATILPFSRPHIVTATRRRPRTTFGMAPAEFWIRAALAAVLGLMAAMVLPRILLILFAQAFLTALGA
jgi:hypothetical protein